MLFVNSLILRTVLAEVYIFLTKDNLKPICCSGEITTSELIIRSTTISRSIFNQYRSRDSNQHLHQLVEQRLLTYKVARLFVVHGGLNYTTSIVFNLLRVIGPGDKSNCYQFS